MKEIASIKKTYTEVDTEIIHNVLPTVDAQTTEKKIEYCYGCYKSEKLKGTNGWCSYCQKPF